MQQDEQADRKYQFFKKKAYVNHKTFSALNYRQDFGTVVKESP